LTGSSVTIPTLVFFFLFPQPFFSAASNRCAFPINHAFVAEFLISCLFGFGFYLVLFFHFPELNHLLMAREKERKKRKKEVGAVCVVYSLFAFVPFGRKENFW
jgi:hypothetical protein